MADYNLGTAQGKITITANTDEVADVTKALGNAETAGKRTAGAVDLETALKKSSTAAVITGGAIVSGLTMAVKSASDFEYGMSQVEAVIGDVPGGMDSIRDAALRIGADTSFSAGEAAVAIEELAKQGISASDILNGAADATVALAAAGQVELPEAAGIAAAALNQFKLGAEDMTSVADIMAGAANASATGVSEIGAAMSFVGPAAKTAGVSFQDAATMVALFANNGIDGARAGNTLKSLITTLAGPTDKAAAEMESLGLLTFDAQKAMAFLSENGVAPASASMSDITSAAAQYIEQITGAEAGTAANTKAVNDLMSSQTMMNNAFFDSEGKMKSMEDVVGLLRDAYAGMSEQEQIASGKILVGSAALPALGAISRTTAEDFDALTEAINSTSAADVASARLGNMQGGLEALGGSIETISIQLGSVLVPIVTDVVAKITELVNWFAGLGDGVQRAIVYISAGAGGLLLFGGLAVKTVLSIQSMIGIVSALATGIKSLALGTKIMSAATKAATAVQWLMNAAMTANPIGIIIAAVAALVAALVWFFTQTDLGREIWSNFMNWLKTAWEAIAAFFTSLWASISGGVTAAWTAIADFFTSLWETVSGAFVTAWNAIIAFLTPIFEFIAALIQTYIDIWVGIFLILAAVLVTIWDAIVSFFQWVWDKIIAIATPAIEWLSDAISSTVSAISAVWETVWGAISDFFSGIWNAIVRFFEPIIKRISDVISSTLSAIKGVWESVWGSIKSFFTTIFEAIRSFLTDKLNAIKAGWESIWNGIKTFFVGIWDGIYAAVSSAVGNVVEKVLSIKDKVMSAMAGVGTWLKNAGEDLIKGFFNGINAMGRWLKDKISGFFNNAVDWAKDVLGIASPSKVFAAIGEDTLRGLNVGLEAQEANVNSTITAIGDGMTSSMRHSIDAVPAVVSGSTDASSAVAATITGSDIDRIVAAITDSTSAAMDSTLQTLADRIRRYYRMEGALT